MNPIDLATVAQIKLWQPGIQPLDDATTDAVLQAAITGVSLDWLRRTGRGPKNWQVAKQSPFNQVCTYTEVYDGTGRDIQFLRNTPIMSVTSLKINGYAIQESTAFGVLGYGISDDGKSIFLRHGGRGRFSPIGGRMSFQQGRQNVEITYTAGFSEQAVANELQTIPAGLTVSASVIPWLADSGVSYFSNGNPLSPVLIAPLQGQYFIQSPGVYLFNAADAAAQVLLNYSAAGTPPDVSLAVTKMVYLTYKRRGWEGLRSVAQKDIGQTTYTSWEVDPSVAEAIRNYTRTALV